MPAGLPRPTVKIRIPWSAAACAAVAGSGDSLFSPSVSRTMTADVWVPAGTGVGAGVGAGERLL